MANTKYKISNLINAGAPKTKGSAVTTRLVRIDGEMATELLQRNTRNRPVSDPVVSRYTKAMKDGDWHLNGEPIIIDENGTLVDGQHRLWAVIYSGVPMEAVIVEGVDPDAFMTIDIGKARTGGDAIAAYDDGLKKNRTVLAAAIQTILCFNERGEWYEKHTKVPHEKIIEFIKDNPRIAQSVEFAGKLSGARNLVSYSCLAALHYVLPSVEKESAEEFLVDLSTGEGLGGGDVVLMLRNRLIFMGHPGRRARTSDVMPYIVKAWEIRQSGRAVKRLSVGNNYVPTISQVRMI